MKRNKIISAIKTRPISWWTLLVMPGLLLTTCHNDERQNELNELDNQITQLNRKITESQDLYNTDVPQQFKSVQKRYIQSVDSVMHNSDSVAFYINQNDSLLARAFDKYATRVGRNFQISNILPQSDIVCFQNHIAKLDSVGYVQEMARERILNNCASINDLYYFLEMLDVDTLNTELENKLGWLFYVDILQGDDSTETSVLGFENQTMHSVWMNEKKLLDYAWQQHTVSSDTNVDYQNTCDTNTQVTDATENIFNDTKTPNFAIPEFDSVRKLYLYNDSVIGAYTRTMQNMFYAEDTLEKKYRAPMMRARDSLILRRQEFEK